MPSQRLAVFLFLFSIARVKRGKGKRKKNLTKIKINQGLYRVPISRIYIKRLREKLKKEQEEKQNFFVLL